MDHFIAEVVSEDGLDRIRWASDEPGQILAAVIDDPTRDFTPVLQRYPDRRSSFEFSIDRRHSNRQEASSAPKSLGRSGIHGQ